MAAEKAFAQLLLLLLLMPIVIHPCLRPHLVAKNYGIYMIFQLNNPQLRSVECAQTYLLFPPLVPVFIFII